MSRFYVPKDSVKEDRIVITGKEAHHILNVLRFSEGDVVSVFDGTGKEYRCSIRSASRKGIVADILDTRDLSEKDPVTFVLVQAIPKKEMMDYIVEKATELGVARIIPVITERTIVRPDKARSASKLKRWMRIAEQASRQCGRPTIPVVDHPKRFSDAVALIADQALCLIAHLEEGTRPLKETLRGFKGKSVIVFIGPERDFTEGEVRLALSRGALPVSLGPRVLKSDTAGLAALSILGYELN